MTPAPKLEAAKSTPGPWLQISGKYISIDNGQSPQVFVAATDADMALMRAAPALRDALKLVLPTLSDAASWTAHKASEADLNCQPPDVRTEMHGLNARLRTAEIRARAVLASLEAQP